MTTVKCRVAAVKRLIVLNHSAHHISFISFGIIESIMAILKIENRTFLKLVLGCAGVGWGRYTALQTTLLYMKRLKKNRTLIFVLLCVLCFQR